MFPHTYKIRSGFNGPLRVETNRHRDLRGTRDDEAIRIQESFNQQIVAGIADLFCHASGLRRPRSAQGQKEKTQEEKAQEGKEEEAKEEKEEEEKEGLTILLFLLYFLHQHY